MLLIVLFMLPRPPGLTSTAPPLPYTPLFRSEQEAGGRRQGIGNVGQVQGLQVEGAAEQQGAGQEEGGGDPGAAGRGRRQAADQCREAETRQEIGRASCRERVCQYV